MSEPDPLKRWAASVRERMVPADFATALPLASAGRLERLWARPAVRAAAWLVAALVLATRVAAAFAFFLLG